MPEAAVFALRASDGAPALALVDPVIRQDQLILL
jgi:hypothetical protein